MQLFYSIRKQKKKHSQALSCRTVQRKKPRETVVAAVGDGKGYEGKDVQMQVKEGDHVIFSKYAGTEVKVEEEEYIIVSPKDIIAVVE